MSRAQADAVALAKDGERVNRQSISQRIALQRIPDSVWRRAIASGALVPPYNYRGENRSRAWTIAFGCIALCIAAFVIAAKVKA